MTMGEMRLRAAMYEAKNKFINGYDAYERALIQQMFDVLIAEYKKLEEYEHAQE